MDDFVRFLKSIRLVNVLTLFSILVMSVVLRKFFSTKLALLFLVLAMGAYLFFILREHIDIWSPETHRILVVILVLMLAYYLGKFIGDGKYHFLVVIASGIYIAFLFKKPEYMLLVSAILIVNMFSLINPDFLRIKGAFKLRDLLLVGSFLPLILKESIRKRGFKQIFNTPCAKAILGFMGLILLYVVFTVVRHSYSFNLSLRIARGYFYYIFFFPVVYFIQKERQLDFLLKSMIALSVIFAIMYIGQAISGAKVFPTVAARSGTIGGVFLIRGGGSFGFTMPMTFGLIGLAGYVDSKRTRFWVTIGLGLFFAAWLLTFGRGGYYIVGATVLLVLIFLPSSRKRRFFMWIGLLFLVSLLLLGLISTVRYGAWEILPTIMRERIVSGAHDFVRRSGTFAGRYNVFKHWFDIVIKRFPLTGMGFLYPGAEVVRNLGLSQITTGHSFIVHMLCTMGSIGMLAYLLLHIVFVIRAFQVLREIKNPIYKGFITGFAAWYISSWASIFTSSSLVSPENITLKAICVGLVEVMYRIDQKKYEFS